MLKQKHVAAALISPTSRFGVPPRDPSGNVAIAVPILIGAGVVGWRWSRGYRWSAGL